MKKAKIRLLSIPITLAMLVLAAVPSGADSRGGSSLKASTPVIQLSAETIALLQAASRSPESLEASAKLIGGAVVAGHVNSKYQIVFDSFPRIWLTAIVSVKLAGGGVFEKCLIVKGQQALKMDAVSTAAVIASGGKVIQYSYWKETLEDAVKRTGAGRTASVDVRGVKAVLAAALVSRNIISGSLPNDVDAYLDANAASKDLKLSIPDFETGKKVVVAGCELSPNTFGIATSQAGLVPGGLSRFMADSALGKGRALESPFHARLRERAAHEHTDVFIDLDTGLSRIVPENAVPEDQDWDLCVRHLRDGWPYIRLNYFSGTEAINLGPVDWESVVRAPVKGYFHGPNRPGILIIAHGEGAPEWNLAVDLAVKRMAELHPENSDWPVELAYLEEEMIEEDSRNAELGLTGKSIADALSRLRDKGVAWVGVIPLMVNNCTGHMEEIRWLMGQSVGRLTSDWSGRLTASDGQTMNFEGFMAAKEGALSGEVAVGGFDADVAKMEGSLSGTVDEAGNVDLEGSFSGYSEDGAYLCELTLGEVQGAILSDGGLGGAFSGAWVKKQKVGGAWVTVGEGALSGDWSLAKTEEGKPDLTGLQVFLGSAIESHPLMLEIQKARAAELLGDRDASTMGVTLGVHGADMTCCEDAWYEMGDKVLDALDSEMGFAAMKTAFMEEVSASVKEHVATYGQGQSALLLHMIAPGSLSMAMPYVVGWPAIRPNVHYLYNQKTLLAYESQDSYTLSVPPFSSFPTLSAAELATLSLDSTSDLFADWMALHSQELVSAYPIDDNWHGEKLDDKMLVMTDNVYIIKTNDNRYAKMRVFTSGNGMVSMEYAYQPIEGWRILK